MCLKRFVFVSVLLLFFSPLAFSEDVLVPEELFLELMQLSKSSGSLYYQDSETLNNSDQTLQDLEDTENQIGVISENLNQNVNSSEEILNSSDQTTNSLDETMSNISETNKELRKSSMKSFLIIGGSILGSAIIGFGAGYIFASF